MPTKLSDIQPSELSFVRRGAVRRQFLFTKADDDTVDVDPKLVDALAKTADGEDAFLKSLFGDRQVEVDHVAAAAAAYRLAAAAGVDHAAVAKAMAAQDTDDEDAELETDEDVCKAYENVVKADFTAEQRAQMAKTGVALPDGSYPIPDRDYLEKAIHAVGRGKNNSHTAIREHIAKRAKALGATSLLPDTWNIKKEDGMTETAQAVPVKKEDGSWDLSAVPEDQRPALELVLKSHADELGELRKEKDTAVSKADEAFEIAKAERDARETREFVAKSETLEHLAKDDTEFGEVLKSIARAEQEKHLPEGTVEKLDTVLKAADEAVEKGALFAEIGRAGHGASSDVEKQLDAKADEIRKSDSSITKEQALEKAYNDNPELYTRLREGSVA